MNLSEFKAWFEGYTEAMEGRPTEKQWKRIQGRVKEIKDAPTSYPVFVDRYWNYPRPYWPQYIGQGVGMGYSGSLQMGQFQNLQCSNASQTIAGTVSSSTDTVKLEWNSADAFRDLGRVDALNG